MTTPHPRPPAEDRTAPIVVGVDGSDHGEAAVRWAARNAAATACPLHLVHALDLAAGTAFGPFDLYVPPVTATLRTRGAAVLDSARRIAAEVDPRVPVEIELTEEVPAAALIARSAHARMTVLGAEGHGGTLRHLGSTLLAVTAHGHGVVTVVRSIDPLDPPVGPVVVGVDGSAFGQAAVEVAFTEASRRGAALVAVHCWTDLRFERLAGLLDVVDEDPEVEAAAAAALAEQLDGWPEKFPDVPVRTQVYRHGPAHHLVEWSRTAQLVVAGSRGRGGFHGLLLGSTSNALVQHAFCPVMIVHPR
ncbi:universal stress protein [Nocardia rhizosphaerae]|uniref:Universal stress protein n=1 Tax=Nocardia rhizosphaerae TaxID=1691571 RepID=A0ABV8LBV6_9NOCA